MKQSSIDRRALLKMAALAIVSPSCALRGRHATEPSLSRRLAKVNVSWDRIIRTVVGLRPGRVGGFRLEAVNVGAKTVIHNYGHGSRGVTLSWGTAHLAVEEAARTGHRQHAVLGCGAVGLATARLLQRRGYDVTIYAKQLPPETTSNVALGMWGPVGLNPNAPAEFRDKFTRAARLSHRYFQDLVGDYYGVRWVEFYSGSSAERIAALKRDPFRDLYVDLQELGPKDHPFPAPSVLRWMNLQIEPPVYLNALTRDFQLAGGRIIVRDFADVSSVLALPEPVVVNCTGLGARSLFDDQTVNPVKGQLIVLPPQPEVDYMCDVKSDVVSRKDGVLLGGGRLSEPNSWTLEPDEQARRASMAEHIAFFAGMK
jgi:D-amino-acid oxidase